MEVLRNNNELRLLTATEECRIDIIANDFLFSAQCVFDVDNGLKGKCKKCGKKIDFDNDPTGLLYIIESVKIEEVEYRGKTYTSQSVLTASQFVKETFSQIILAIQKKFRLGVSLCDDCSPDLDTPESIILSKAKVKSFMPKTQWEIMKLW